MRVGYLEQVAVEQAALVEQREHIEADVREAHLHYDLRTRSKRWQFGPF